MTIRQGGGDRRPYGRARLDASGAVSSTGGRYGVGSQYDHRASRAVTRTVRMGMSLEQFLGSCDNLAVQRFASIGARDGARQRAWWIRWVRTPCDVHTQWRTDRMFLRRVEERSYERRLGQLLREFAKSGEVPSASSLSLLAWSEPFGRAYWLTRRNRFGEESAVESRLRHRYGSLAAGCDVEFWGVPSSSRHELYPEVDEVWTFYEAPRFLCVPTPAVYAYYSSWVLQGWYEEVGTPDVRRSIVRAVAQTEFAVSTLLSWLHAAKHGITFSTRCEDPRLYADGLSECPSGRLFQLSSSLWYLITALDISKVLSGSEFSASDVEACFRAMARNRLLPQRDFAVFHWKDKKVFDVSPREAEPVGSYPNVRRRAIAYGGSRLVVASDAIRAEEVENEADGEDAVGVDAPCSNEGRSPECVSQPYATSIGGTQVGRSCAPRGVIMSGGTEALWASLASWILFRRPEPSLLHIRRALPLGTSDTVFIEAKSARAFLRSWLLDRRSEPVILRTARMSVSDISLELPNVSHMRTFGDSIEMSSVDTPPSGVPNRIVPIALADTPPPVSSNRFHCNRGGAQNLSVAGDFPPVGYTRAYPVLHDSTLQPFAGRVICQPFRSNVRPRVLPCATMVKRVTPVRSGNSTQPSRTRAVDQPGTVSAIDLTATPHTQGQVDRDGAPKRSLSAAMVMSDDQQKHPKRTQVTSLAVTESDHTMFLHLRFLTSALGMSTPSTIAEALELAAVAFGELHRIRAASPSTLNAVVDRLFPS